MMLELQSARMWLYRNVFRGFNEIEILKDNFQILELRKRIRRSIIEISRFSNRF